MRRERQHATELHHGIKPAVRHDRVLVGIHVLAVDLFELLAAFALAVEQLQHDDADDVLLQIGIDPAIAMRMRR